MPIGHENQGFVLYFVIFLLKINLFLDFLCFYILYAFFIDSDYDCCKYRFMIVANTDITVTVKEIIPAIFPMVPYNWSPVFFVFLPYMIAIIANGILSPKDLMKSKLRSPHVIDVFPYFFSVDV